VQYIRSMTVRFVMRLVVVASLGLLLCLVDGARVHAAPPTGSEELNIAVGENLTISAAEVKSYSIAAPGIADVKVTPQGNQFVVIGLKPGATSLLTLNRDGSETTYTINVFTRPLKVVASELSELLGGMTGVRVRKVGARFFIEGGVSSEADLKRVETIASLYGGQVQSLVTQGGAAADSKINIRVDFFFVQYDKTKLRQAGISWPGQVGGQAISSNFAYDFIRGAVTSATASVTDHPLPALDIASRSGWAKVMKHSTVIASNGTEALFSSGGAQNYMVTTGLAAAIHKINFGTDVKVLPRFDPSSREMAVKIEADVADLIPAIGETNLPGQNLSKLVTNVALKLGESVVLSGIRSTNERRLNSGIPWLSEIPVLGILFGSRGLEYQETEGALFIVPSVIDTANQHAEELLERAIGEFGDYDGDLDDVSPGEIELSKRRGTKQTGGR